MSFNWLDPPLFCNTTIQFTCTRQLVSGSAKLGQTVTVFTAIRQNIYLPFLRFFVLNFPRYTKTHSVTMSFLSHFAGLQPSNTFTGLNADTASLFDGSDTSSIRHYFDSHETHDNNGHHEAQPAYKLSSEEGHDTDLDDFSVGQRAYRDNNSESSGVTDADTPEDRSTVTDNRAPSVELPPAKQRRTNGAPKLASVLMSELAPPEVQLRSSDLTQEQRDDRNLHRKACLVKPNTELPGKNRFWIGVLNPDVNVSRVRKESDFIWMKGHGVGLCKGATPRKIADCLTGKHCENHLAPLAGSDCCGHLLQAPDQRRIPTRYNFVGGA